MFQFKQARFGSPRHRPIRTWGRHLQQLSEQGSLRLIASEALIEVGILARIAAQSWVAYDLTASSLWVGVVASARAIPSLICPFLSRSIVDRFDHRLLAASMRGFIGVLAVIQAILIGTGRMLPWHQLVLTLLTGLAIAIAGPAFFAYLYELVNPGANTRAKFALAFAHNSGEMLGPLSVGVFIATIGADWAFVFIAILYFAGSLLLLNVPSPPRLDIGGDDNGSHLNRLKTGFRRATNDRPVLALLLMLAGTNLFGMAIFPLIPEYAVDVYSSGGLGFGLMTGLFGGGLALGSGIISIYGLPRRLAMTVFLTGLAWVCGTVAFAFSPNLPVALIVLATTGVFGMIWASSVLDLIHLHTPTTSRRSVAGLSSITMSLIPIGWAVGGAMAMLAGNTAALLISAALSAVFLIGAFVASSELRRW